MLPWYYTFMELYSKIKFRTLSRYRPLLLLHSPYNVLMLLRYGNSIAYTHSSIRLHFISLMQCIHNDVWKIIQVEHTAKNWNLIPKSEYTGTRGEKKQQQQYQQQQQQSPHELNVAVECEWLEEKRLQHNPRSMNDYVLTAILVSKTSNDIYICDSKTPTISAIKMLIQENGSDTSTRYHQTQPRYSLHIDSINCKAFRRQCFLCALYKAHLLVRFYWIQPHPHAFIVWFFLFIFHQASIMASLIIQTKTQWKQYRDVCWDYFVTRDWLQQHHHYGGEPIRMTATTKYMMHGITMEIKSKSNYVSVCKIRVDIDATGCEKKTTRCFFF